MPTKHTVEEGEDLSTIAYQQGFLMETIWDDAANAELKEKRKTPYVLCAGDEVVVPDKTPRDEALEASKRLKFRRKGGKEDFSMRLCGPFGEPRCDLAYKLTIGETVLEGKTDAEGKITAEIPIDAAEAVLELGDDGLEVMGFKFGHLDPIDTVSGCQARLKAVGCDPGEIDGKETEATKAAVEAFQARSGIDPVTGTIDDPTREALKAAYGI
jgi:hypothetical protein